MRTIFPELAQGRCHRLLRYVDEAETRAKQAATPHTRDTCLKLAEFWREFAAQVKHAELEDRADAHRLSINQDR